jgi:uncharacterized protein (DUF1697 family)
VTPRSTAATPQRYVAFLRAINVGGHTVKMDRLRAEFEALRFRDVATFIASGNVLFSTPSREGAELETRIERRLEKTLGYPVATFLRTPEELQAIVNDEPFPDRDPASTLWVGFVKTAVPAEARERLLALRTAIDEFEVRGREAFWLRRERSMAQLVTGARIDRALQSATTFRNVTTVRKLALLTASGAG